MKARRVGKEGKRPSKEARRRAAERLERKLKASRARWARKKAETAKLNSEADRWLRKRGLQRSEISSYKAKTDGTCAVCRRPIEKGVPIVKVRDDRIHLACVPRGVKVLVKGRRSQAKDTPIRVVSGGLPTLGKHHR